MKTLILAAMVVSASSAWANVSKVGFVDMQKAIQATEAGKKGKKELEEEFKKKDKELKGKADDLKKMREDLDKKSMVLSDEVRAKKEAEWQEEMGKFRALTEKSQMELRKREADLTNPIIEKMMKVVEKKGKDGDYSFILQKNDQVVLFMKKELDITDEVIKDFEKAK